MMEIQSAAMGVATHVLLKLVGIAIQLLGQASAIDIVAMGWLKLVKHVMMAT